MKTKSPDSVRVQSCRGLVALAALCFAAASSTVWAATVIDLDATQLPEGPLNTWVNKGTLPGDFTSAGTTAPTVVKAKAGKGIQFSSTAHYVGPEVPTSLTGNASRTIEAWVFNPTAQGEETVFAWGRRGADGINCSFGHGTDLSFGAVGHWGTADIGWEGNITFGEWTYIVYTYDGDYQTTTVYKDGVVANSEVLSSPLDTAAVSDSGAPLHFRVARQNTAAGGVSGTGVGDIIIGKIRVHDVALDAETILAHYNAEVDLFIERDTDGDGMPDWWESLYPAFLNINDKSDAALDQDNDGLTNLREYQNKTMPDNPDTDGDGVKDGAEVDRTVGGSPAPTDPTKPDTDADGLSDGVETGTGVFQNAQDTGSDPLKTDTDDDTFGDWQEVLHGTNPCNASSTPQDGRAPIVVLDATKLPAGPLPTWDNTGLLPGDFLARDTGAAPQVTTILGVNGVQFDGNEYYTGPAAPSWVTGNGPHTVEAWVYNPSIADEETVFAWGRRGGGDGSNCSFNHGANAAYGAVGHWGGPDLGWDGNIVAGQWTHIAYSWNPSTMYQTVYKDGQPAASEYLANPLAIWAVATDGKPLPFRVASQNDDNGSATAGLRGSMTIAKITVYDYALDDAAILQHYTSDAGTFGILDEDNDGMPTWYERQFDFLNPNDKSDAAKDQDSDGLTNLEEFQIGTRPDNPDTDDDGVLDGTEVKTLGTRPLVADTDQDGLNDGQEVTATTDPLNADSDFDTFADGLEVVRGSDPKSAGSVPSFEQTVAIIDVDAANLPIGPLEFWPNNGALHGRFKAGTPTPEVQIVGGVKAVTFDGTMYYSGPVAPTWMVGDSARTVEAWVYNPQIATEETVFAWGRRGGPDGSNCSFNHGTDAVFGAVGHWGVADVGWNGKISAGQWNHIAYTYNPATYEAIVYSAGQPANTNDIFSAIGAGLNTHGVNDAPEPDAVPLTFLIAAQHDANGAVTETLRGSLSIARIRVYDQALSADAIAQIYNAEVGKYSAITIQSITYNAATDALTITWNAVPGAKYEVVATSVLGTAWTPIATDLTTGTYTDHPATAGSQRFYRIRLK
ncbi:MAG: hypothetical protein GX456_17540 [Verrucomicrobia bacterium]|nr:hypothetical protein [Verrucomicrobiota bacterium]